MESNNNSFYRLLKVQNYELSLLDNNVIKEEKQTKKLKQVKPKEYKPKNKHFF